MISSIIMAAGKGYRIGGKKQCMSINEISLFTRVLRTFDSCEKIDSIYIVANNVTYDYIQNKFNNLKLFHKVEILKGGFSRQESVLKALNLINNKTKTVLIHDGNRPFVPRKLILKSISGASKTGACIPVIPVNESLIEISKSSTKFIDRNNKWIIQTPQVFDFELIFNSHILAKKNKYYANEDSSIAANSGALINVVKGSSLNIKITSKNDIITASTLANFLDKYGINKCF